MVYIIYASLIIALSEFLTLIKFYGARKRTGNRIRIFPLSFAERNPTVSSVTNNNNKNVRRNNFFIILLFFLLTIPTFFSSVFTFRHSASTTYVKEFIEFGATFFKSEILCRPKSYGM